MSNFWALVQILKALIDLFSYLTGKISQHQYHERLEEMQDSIKRATTGKLSDRLEGGREVEDQLNRGAKK